MPKPNYRYPFEKQYAQRLNKAARVIVERAFFMGGTHVRFFRALPCSYVFPDGTSCRQPLRGAWNPECPQCRGLGAGAYEPPIDTVAIIVSNQHEMQPDKAGWQYGKQVRVVTPVQVRPTTFKIVDDGRQYRLPDKFEVLDQNGQVWYLGYCADDVDEPFFYGPLYNRVSVQLSAPPGRPENYDLPGAPSFSTVREFGERVETVKRGLPATAHMDLTESNPSADAPTLPTETDPWGWK